MKVLTVEMAAPDQLIDGSIDYAIWLVSSFSQILTIVRVLIVKTGAHVWIKFMHLSAFVPLDSMETIAKAVRTTGIDVVFYHVMMKLWLRKLVKTLGSKYVTQMSTEGLDYGVFTTSEQQWHQGLYVPAWFMYAKTKLAGIT